MREISFLAIAHSPDTEPSLRLLLDEFERQNRIKVNLEMVSWETAWKDLVKSALYHGGPDVCETPSTWVSDLMAMNALRSFKQNEINSLGNTTALLEPAWKSCKETNGSTFWAVPWIIDTRVMYYRKDLLEKAGVDAETAFSSTRNMEATLRSLQESGVRIPWIVQTLYPNVNTLHNLATWVWSAGGDFVDPSTKQILFTQPEALAGMRAFYGLHRFISPEVSNMDYTRAEEFFWRGEAAVVMAGPNFVVNEYPEMASDVRENIAAVLPPGVPFIGGSHISIWGHTIQPEASIELVRFLVSPSVQSRLSSTTLLPARLDAYDSPGVTQNPMVQVLLDGLKKGRSYPFFSMWGLLEDRLVPVLSQIWKDVLEDRGSDLDLILTKHLEPLARKLSMTFRS